MTAERDAILVAASAMRAALSEHVHVHGFEHEDDCPEDDTCACPLVLAVNEADAALRSALAIRGVR